MAPMVLTVKNSMTVLAVHSEGLERQKM